MRVSPHNLAHSAQKAILSRTAAVMLSAVVVPALARGAEVAAPDTIGIDDKGQFGLCPDNAMLTSCVSSQDDKPAVFLAPWCYDGSYSFAKDLLLSQILSIPGATVKRNPTMEDNDRLVAVEFRDPANNAFIDDAEFYFTPNDNTIQFRSIRRGNQFDFGANRKRIEQLRIALRFESVPVLRSRKLSLWFGESAFDSFGPSTNTIDDITDLMNVNLTRLFDNDSRSSRVSSDARGSSSSSSISSSSSSYGGKYSSVDHNDISLLEIPTTPEAIAAADSVSKGAIGELRPVEAPLWATAVYPKLTTRHTGFSSSRTYTLS